MDVERIGGVTLYEFNWVEHLVANAVIKHLDRQRRSGRVDQVPVNSALRAIFVDDAPRNDSLAPVRWILDEDEYLGSSPDEAHEAPIPETLLEVADYAYVEITNCNNEAVTRPLGRFTLSQSGNALQRTYRSESLATLTRQIELFSDILRDDVIK